MLINSEQISMKQGSKYIVKDIDWQIEEKENWILFGLNGCGKTTLLSILSGYKKGTHGRLSLFDQEVTEENIIALRKQIGWVSGSFFDRYYSQEIVLDMVLSGKFGILGIDGEVDHHDVRKAKRLLDRFGLKAQARYPYDLLSKGQQQKVLIARALMSQPKILILDEPCTGLDIFAKRYFLQSIEQMSDEENVTIIYVTHNTDEILPFFDKAALMKEGRLHSQGAIQEIFQKDNLTDFFGIPTDVTWSEENLYIHLHIDQENTAKKKFMIAEKEASSQ